MSSTDCFVRLRVTCPGCSRRVLLSSAIERNKKIGVVRGTCPHCSTALENRPELSAEAKENLTQSFPVYDEAGFYREMLKAYVHYVIDEEGVSFLEDYKSLRTLPQQFHEELREIEQEVMNERKAAASASHRQKARPSH